MCNATMEALIKTMNDYLDRYDRLLDRAIALSGDSALERALEAYEAERETDHEDDDIPF